MSALASSFQCASPAMPGSSNTRASARVLASSATSRLVGSSWPSGLKAAEGWPVTPKGSRTWTGPNFWRARPAILAFSPLGSMQIMERSAVSRLGMMVPTPLPVRVGAIVSRWAGPS
ncbi:Uncharacterised protein [Mycobacterium tuberculosis]|nr:Uncharacterised protein [Mycobacterium tuberculosis]